MKQSIFKITSNEKIARDIFKMTLAGDTSAITAPGQFVNIKLDGFFLRRPISVCDCVGENLTLIYKTVGHGTELGNGYNTKKSGGSPLLVGGGVGVPPMYMLCRELISEGKNVTVVLGFNSKDDVFYEDEFRALGADVHIATADGTYGTKGFVTDVIKDMQYTFFYTCGPEPMFRAMHKIMKTPGQYSFEERMGCGFGACMGCSCKTLTGNKRICKEGPVMESEEIIWAD
jgi:dihydroorotate dehydrogenase electron transfer subunit